MPRDSRLLEFLEGAIGFYRPTITYDRPDCIIANSFGTETGPRSVNAAVKKFAVHKAIEYRIPMIMDAKLAESAGAYIGTDDLIVYGDISGALGGGVGTYGVLEAAKPFMDERGLKRPMIVGQSCHVNRIALQARSAKIGMNPIVPPDLPYVFDKGSGQIWTRSLPLWLIREIPGTAWLKITGKL